MIRQMFNRYREIIVYLIVGCLTTIVSLSIYFVCVSTFLDPNDALKLQLANIIAWVGAVAFAYVTNRRFVFRSENDNKVKEGFSFVSSRLGTLGVDMFVMFLLVTVIGMNDKIAKLIVQVVVTVLNYVLSKFLVFNKKEV